MAKKSHSILLLTVGLILLAGLLFTPLRAENETAILDKETLEHIGSLSLADAEKMLDDEIVDIDNMLSYLERIEQMTLSFSLVDNDKDDEPESEYWYTEPFSLLTTSELDKLLSAEDNEPVFKFYQTIYSGHSKIELETRELEKILSQAVLKKIIFNGKYKVTKIYFKDGSELDTSVLEPDGSDLTYKNFTIEHVKPIERMDIDIHYVSSPSYQKIVLDKDNSVFKQNGDEDYRLTAINNKQASLLLSIPKSKNYYIEGIAANGQALESRGSNSVTSPTKKERALLTDYYKALRQTKRDFKRFKNSQELKVHLENAINDIGELSDDLKTIQTDVYFKTKPKKVVVYLIDKEENSVLSRRFINDITSAELYVAIDETSEKAGLVDKTGAWVIKPKFDNIQHTQFDNIYYIEMDTGPGSESPEQILYGYFILSPDAKEFQELPFEGLGKKITDELALVQRETNGSYGVYNVKTRQMVIPMKFVKPKIMDDVFIASLGEKTYGYKPQYGAYTLQGKEILAPKYDYIEGLNGLLYVGKKQRDVFTPDGKKLTPAGYNAIGYFHGDQPLLIQNVKNEQYKFIDVKGNLLKIDLPYDEVEPFSNGMAIVIKDGKRGAINLSGKLVIPFDYKDIYDFQKNFAAAEPYSERYSYDTILIDKNNNTVKNLGPVIRFSVMKNSNNARYTVSDRPTRGYNTVFDADGNVIKTYKRE